jgi:hypothetical protein
LATKVSGLIKSGLTRRQIGQTRVSGQAGGTALSGANENQWFITCFGVTQVRGLVLKVPMPYLKAAAGQKNY